MFSLAIASIVWGLVLAASGTAQPILNRVEQLFRDQVEAARQTSPPAEPGYLGLTADDTVDAPRGVRVLEVVEGRAAAQAGLRAGDLITRIDERPIRGMDDMAQALEGKPAGTKLSITATRGDAPQRFNVTLSRRAEAAAAGQNSPPATGPPAADRPRLGVRSVPVSDDIRRQNNLPAARGAHVISVAVGSPAERAGIPLGAIITAVDATPVGTPQQLAEAIQNSRATPVELTYVHRGQTARTRVELAAPMATVAKPQPQVRARPPVPELPAPAEVKPPAVENPALARDDQLEKLERRIQELEARIKALEAEKAQREAAPQTTPPK
jgi:S1-C subfamily serine protease